MSYQPVNLFRFSAGHLNFNIKIPENISFKIGIIDSWGNQSYVDFPSYQTMYGLERNSNWGQASIPVGDIRGESIDLRMLSYGFVILEVNGNSCDFALDNIYWSGGAENLSISNLSNSLKDFRLYDNYPNPFNPITTITFSLPEDELVNITIYNMVGRKINTLLRSKQTAGFKSIQWNATNNQGQPVSAGVYLMRIQAGQFSQTKKMVLLN